MNKYRDLYELMDLKCHESQSRIESAYAKIKAEIEAETYEAAVKKDLDLVKSLKQEMDEINHAYDILSNPVKREMYDINNGHKGCDHSQKNKTEWFIAACFIVGCFLITICFKDGPISTALVKMVGMSPAANTKTWIVCSRVSGKEQEGCQVEVFRDNKFYGSISSYDLADNLDGVDFLLNTEDFFLGYPKNSSIEIRQKDQICFQKRTFVDKHFRRRPFLYASSNSFSSSCSSCSNRSFRSSSSMGARSSR